MCIHVLRLILSNQNNKTYGKPTLRLVPIAFFMDVVVVTTGVGVVFRLISYFRNFSYVENIRVLFIYIYVEVFLSTYAIRG